MKLLPKFIRHRIEQSRKEKRLIASLPPGAEEGCMDALFIQTGKHHKKES